MKKMKLFFVAASLVLVTAGVFAGKAKFLESGVYYLNGSAYTPIASSPITPFTLTNTGTSQAKLVSSEGNGYFLYTVTATSPSVQYSPLYTVTGF
jgi:hypothetical protein